MNGQLNNQDADLSAYRQSIRGFQIATPEIIDTVISDASNETGSTDSCLKYLKHYVLRFIVHEKLKQEVENIVRQQVSQLSSVEGNSISITIVRYMLKRIIVATSDECQTIYNSFPLNKEELRTRYKVMHIEMNKCVDASYNQQENMKQIDNIFEGLYSYCMIVNQNDVNNSNFLTNTLRWLTNEQWWISKYGQGILVKGNNTKDKRYHRQLLLLCPFAMGNDLNWDCNEYSKYCVVGSEPQNVSMGSYPACAKTPEDLSGPVFVVTLHDIKSMIDAFVQEDTTTFEMLRKSINWSVDGYGPELARMFSEFSS